MVVAAKSSAQIVHRYWPMASTAGWRPGGIRAFVEFIAMIMNDRGPRYPNCVMMIKTIVKTSYIKNYCVVLFRRRHSPRSRYGMKKKQLTRRHFAKSMALGLPLIAAGGSLLTSQARSARRKLLGLGWRRPRRQRQHEFNRRSFGRPLQRTSGAQLRFQHGQIHAGG